MYECPGCAGNLKFDIARQNLFCEHCNLTVDTYSVHKEQDAEEHSGQYETTVFICPQCGGEILSEDTTAATFCSFCGAATILDSRVAKERRPAYIIPFSKTREDCKKSYARMMRRAFFAPKAFKDKENIEKFRGIYIPYWVYSFEKNESVGFPGYKSHRRGDYLIYKEYRMECDINSSYEGLAYDASASFADHLSGAIAPFDLENKKEFTPAFLSGFYADTSDVDKWVYQDEAEDMVVNDGAAKLSHNSMCKKYSVTDSSIKKVVRPACRKAELAMFPVWFLSYRNKDRVSYAVVNGQTGRTTAEMPIDPVKYMIGTAVLTIPIFILLNHFFTFTPTPFLILASLLALCCIFIANVQMSNLLARESGEMDKGLAFAQSKNQNLAEEIADGRQQAVVKGQNRTSSRLGKILARVAIFFAFSFLAQTLLPIIIFYMITSGRVPQLTNNMPLIITVIAVVILFSFVRVIKKAMVGAYGNAGRKQIFYWGHWEKKLPTLLKPAAGILISIFIIVLHPVSDWFYYLGAIACLGTVFWAFTDIIKHHNEWTTRKLPQFSRRGGDENA